MTENTSIPKLREYWAGQGGRLAGIIGGEGDEAAAYLIIVCDAEQKPIILEDIEYGCYGVEVEGADNRRNGFKNAQALLKSGGSQLAEKATAVVVDGHSDCYPPSQAELDIINANFPEFDDLGWVLSSTQYSANHAWYQTFGSGLTYRWSKDNRDRAFVVRRVPM